ncbi:hypothetical protein BCON_0035g00200 [Botryotinia convoluta]|uniref:Uncharacterized protein n=1 Tax=Botryotinia convoluta TaxID=54673 RepID=A0A4Z1IIU6_9HELO|nr:hypothetical protein BCON_0035g00200 [Botryotinia convoluta]
MRLKPTHSLTVHHHEPHARTAHPPIQSNPSNQSQTHESAASDNSSAMSDEPFPFLTKRVITTIR